MLPLSHAVNNDAADADNFFDATPGTLPSPEGPVLLIDGLDARPATAGLFAIHTHSMLGKVMHGVHVIYVVQLQRHSLAELVLMPLDFWLYHGDYMTYMSRGGTLKR